MMLEAYNNVQSLLSDLRAELLAAGVPERQLRMPTGRNPDDIKLDQYVKAFDWLHRISISGEMIAVKKARALVTHETWAKYEAYGFTGLQEQLILEKAHKALRRAWKTNRPSFFGRVYREESEQDTDSDSIADSGVRPQEAGTDESDC